MSLDKLILINLLEQAVNIIFKNLLCQLLIS